MLHLELILACYGVLSLIWRAARFARDRVTDARMAAAAARRYGLRAARRG